MEYEHNFERDFIERTLRLVGEYGERYEATLLLNCLLGLVVLPNERFLRRLPDLPISSLREWGIHANSIRRFGKCRCGDPYPKTLAQFVRCIRNAVAHFQVKPLHKEGKVFGFAFKEDSGFHAELPLAEIRAFVDRFASQVCPKTNAA